VICVVPIVLLIHLLSRLISGDGGASRFERRHLHDLISRVREQEVRQRNQVATARHDVDAEQEMLQYKELRTKNEQLNLEVRNMTDR
jgi:hypothetical protein